MTERRGGGKEEERERERQGGQKRGGGDCGNGRRLERWEDQPWTRRTRRGEVGMGQHIDIGHL